MCTVVQGEFRCPGCPFSSPKTPSGAAPATPPEPGRSPSSPCLTAETLSSLSGHHPCSLVRASCAKFKFIFSSTVVLETTSSTPGSPEQAQGRAEVGEAVLRDPEGNAEIAGNCWHHWADLQVRDSG